MRLPDALLVLVLPILATSPVASPQNVQATSVGSVSQGPSRTPRWPLFADGSVSCTGADDLSRSVGSVSLTPEPGGVAFRVQLDLGPTMAGWTYCTELSLDGACASPLWYFVTLDAAGSALLTGSYPAPSGAQQVLAELISAELVDPADPMLRELATGAPVPVLVPDDGTQLLTLGFDGASGPLPWSRQGFTFSGDGSISGQELQMVSLGGFGGQANVKL